MLGNGRLEAMCFDGVKRLCHIRGKLRKKVSPPNPYPASTVLKDENMAELISFQDFKAYYPQVWINQSDIVLIGLRDYQVLCHAIETLLSSFIFHLQCL